MIIRNRNYCTINKYYLQIGSIEHILAQNKVLGARNMLGLLEIIIGVVVGVGAFVATKVRAIKIDFKGDDEDGE